jgi:serine/threonine-protein kinase
MTEPLGDRYEIGTELGSGGMATVYSGRDRVLGRPVAIKMLADRYAGDDKFVTRFRREARAAAGLNHQNIVSVFDTGDTNGQHYIVMELVQGETLADLLKREGPLSPDRAARIGGAVARALQAAHDRGFVHRDVKPGNVMITPSGEVKVMDFGIARAATDDTLTQTGMVLGTASYLSPEQSRGDAVDHRSDVYSLGCVLYEMLGGRPPFEADTPVSLAYKHVNEDPQPLGSSDPAIPGELDAVVMKALEKDPDRRFSSARELGEALMGAVAGEPTEPMNETTAVMPQTTVPMRAVSGRRRSWVPLGLIAAVLLIGGVVALAVSLGSDDGRRREGGEGKNRRPAALQTSEPSPPPSEVEQALFALRLLVQEAGAVIPADAAQGILAEAQLAVEAHERGDLDEALTRLEFADASIDQAFVDETTSDLASALHRGVDLLRTTMGGDSQLELIEEPEGSGPDEGPGNSENAPGHTKHDEDKGKDEEDDD